MLTPQELNETVLGTGWRWDPDDEVLWVRAFAGPYSETRPPVEIIASFMIVESDGVTVGYRDPEWYVEYDVRNAALERVHYACLTLPGAEERSVLEWLKANSTAAESTYWESIETVLKMPNQEEAFFSSERQRRVPSAGAGPGERPKPRKQDYTVAYRVTGTFTYNVEASSPECAFHAGDMAGWEAMEFEVDEIHAVTVSFDAPHPAGGWKRVHLTEDELNLEEHGGEDEEEADDAGG